MGLFSKKHKKSYYDYAYINEENTGYPMLDDEGILPIGQRSDLNFAPHALTADEVKGNEPALLLLRPISRNPYCFHQPVCCFRKLHSFLRNGRRMYGTLWIYSCFRFQNDSTC